MMKVRLIELFAGIGSQAKALEKLGVDFEHYRAVEFDKYAVCSYNAIHETNFETSDITEINADDLGIVDTDKFTYIMTYSFPCQDLSLAGKRAGMEKGSGTRSGLLWEVERLLNECNELPQILLMENVPQVHSKKNIEDFNKWQEFLTNKGYTNYWKDLNAKDYGIPQNRNRCFMVSFLNNKQFEFPKPFELELRLKDMLENYVDNKFYLSKKMFNYVFNIDNEAKGIGFSDAVDNSFINPNIANTLSTKSLGGHSQRSGTSSYVSDYFNEPIRVSDVKKTISAGIKIPAKEIEIANCITSRYYKGLSNYNPETAVLEIENCVDEKYYLSEKMIDGFKKHNEHHKEKGTGFIWETRNPNGVASCIRSNAALCPTDNTVAELMQVGSVDLGNNEANNRVYSSNGISPTLNTMQGGHRQPKIIEPPYRIRKLTPLECWRLMGFDDEDFYKAKQSLNDTFYKGKDKSNSQLYKQAGNSIVVDVLFHIFKEIFDPSNKEKEQMDIFDYVKEE